jgi:hypothetical protein
MTITTTQAIEAIALDVVAELLVSDDLGNAPVLLVHEGGAPLRCCLRRTRPGEHVALVSYAPLRRWAAERGVVPGPYDEVGPVFVHPTPCAGFTEGGWPSDLRDGPRVLRCYDTNGHILGGQVVEARGRFEEVLDGLLANPSVAIVHARALEFGCFTFAIRRLASATQHDRERSGVSGAADLVQDR